MQITAVTQLNDRLTWLLHTDSYVAANKFRQKLMMNIPSLAIEYVAIKENDSRFYEEYLAHRLSLIPLVRDDNSIKEAHFDLHVYNTEGIKDVLSSDLIPRNPKVRPLYPDLLICRLCPGESISLSAQAKEGTGDEHAKWSPITMITYNKEGDAYRFEMELLGNISGTEILSSGFLIWLSRSEIKTGKAS